MRTSREEWRKRVERWKDSGLTAEQYASELAINAKTLRFWKYKLAKPVPLAQRAKRRPPVEATLLGQKAERLPRNDAQLSLAILDLMPGGEVSPSVPQPPAEEQTVAEHTRRQPKRKALPETLPRGPIEIDSSNGATPRSTRCWMSRRWRRRSATHATSASPCAASPRRWPAAHESDRTHTFWPWTGSSRFCVQIVPVLLRRKLGLSSVRACCIFNDCVRKRGRTPRAC